MELETIIGAEQSAFTLSGDNSIDVFPVAVFDSSNPTNPSLGSITIQGVTYRTELWDVGDEKTYKYELNHQYKSGENCELHCRVFPTTDSLGTFSFEYEYFILHVDGTTSAGTTVTGNGAFETGDKTANKGQYVSMPINGASLISGDMLIGVFSRSTGTNSDDVSISEVGLHIPVGKTGDDLGG